MKILSRGGIPLPDRKPIVAQCEGCDHVVEGEGVQVCEAYADPAMKWSMGPCNLATHYQRAAAVEEKKVNPLKASKQAMKGRKA